MLFENFGQQSRISVVLHGWFVCRSAGGSQVDSQSDGAATADRAAGFVRYFDVRNYWP